MIYAIDIDGTICTGKFWAEWPKPKQDVIDQVNKLYMEGHTIIYHTARHPRYYQETYGWLVAHGCYFHALEMGKLTADIYIDDRNITLETFMQIHIGGVDATNS